MQHTKTNQLEKPIISYKEKIIDDDFTVEFEVLPAYEEKIYQDLRKKDISESLTEVDSMQEELEDKISRFNTEIDRLTNHADGIDYTIAVSSGILCGLLDVFVVGEFNVDQLKERKEKVTEQFKEKVEEKYLNIKKKETIESSVRRAKEKAAKKGEKLSSYEIKKLKEKVSESVEKSFLNLKNGENGTVRALKRSIVKLEKVYNIQSDNLFSGNDIGVGAVSHHLDDLAHHPSILGLVAIFAGELLRIGIFENKKGKWNILSLDNKETKKKVIITIVLIFL